MVPRDPRHPLVPAAPPATTPASRRRETPLPYFTPTIGEEEAAAVTEALRSGWVTTGPRARAFEDAFAAETGAAGAVALNSCSAGLHTALAVLGIGSGIGRVAGTGDGAGPAPRRRTQRDAVVTTPFTFAATLHAIRHAGAEIVLADISPDSLTLCPESAERAARAAAQRGLRVRAFLPVHYAGHPADLPAIEDLAERTDAAVVEDAAHALGARIGDRSIGSQPSARASARTSAQSSARTSARTPSAQPSAQTPSRVRSLASFSFYANKNITTGDGGMLTAPDDLLPAIRAFAHHGIERNSGSRMDPRQAPWRYDIACAGFKYGMTDLAAAVGLVQLRRLPAFQARRHAIAARYSAAFAGTDAVETPQVRPGMTHAWHLYVIRLRLDALTIDRDRFAGEMERRGIGVSVHYRPAHLQPAYRACFAATDLPVVDDVWTRVLSLPIHPGLADDDADDVIAAVDDVCRTFRR